MISFEKFVNAIHGAILKANEALMDRNTQLLDKYFLEMKELHPPQSAPEGPASESGDDESQGAPEAAADYLAPTGILSAKSVVIQYPHQTSNGIEYAQVHVPLITLVPLTMSQIEKATMTAEFDMEIVDGELQLNFTNSSTKTPRRLGKRRRMTRGKLEITLAPHETPEGLKILVQGYEAALKSQIAQ